MDYRDPRTRGCASTIAESRGNMFSERILIIPFSARFKKFHLIFWPEMCILKTVLRWLPLGVGGSGRRGAMMCPGKQFLNRGKFQSLEIRLKIPNFPPTSREVGPTSREVGEVSVGSWTFRDDFRVPKFSGSLCASIMHHMSSFRSRGWIESLGRCFSARFLPTSGEVGEGSGDLAIST